MKNNIVIIGAGFGGLTTAVRVAAQRKKLKGCQITLIDKGAKHLYYPLIYEVATGYLDFKSRDEDSFRHNEGELIAGSSVPFDDLQKALSPKGVKLLYAEVVDVDWNKRSVVLSDDRKIPFQELIIAMGGEPNTFGIEGLQDHAHMLYSLRGALAIRRNLHTLIEKKRKKEIPLIRVVIGGAGPTGVEFACELGAFMKKLVRKKVLHESDYTIEIVEAGDKPLRNFHPDISKWAEKRLEHFGVKLILNTLIKGTHKNHIVLKSQELQPGQKPEDVTGKNGHNGEKEVIYELLVWTGGSKASDFLKKFDLPLDKRGRIEIDPTFQVRGMDHVWALGDCATLMDPKTGHPVPPLAQAAIAQGKIVAENIFSYCNKQKPKPYDFPKMNAIIPLGGSYGAADVYGVRLKGRLVYPLKLAAEARYFFKTLPCGIAWRMFWSSFWAYRRND